MRLFAVALAVVLALLQYRLWASDDGIRSVTTLRAGVAAQVAENQTLVRRNGQLVAEVKDLKEGLAALEERARTDLGMIGANETFFQVVEAGPRGAPSVPAPASPPAPAPSLPIQRIAR
jgi:cell division protein FtsB